VQVKDDEMPITAGHVRQQLLQLAVEGVILLEGMADELLGQRQLPQIQTPCHFRGGVDGLIAWTVQIHLETRTGVDDPARHDVHPAFGKRVLLAQARRLVQGK